jgi:hypothetical protein
VDLVERFLYLYIVMPDKDGLLLGCIPPWTYGRIAQKVGQLVVSFVWTAVDLADAATSAPGKGTLVLGSFACILQVRLGASSKFELVRVIFG